MRSRSIRKAASVAATAMAFGFAAHAQPASAPSEAPAGATGAPTTAAIFADAAAAMVFLEAQNWNGGSIEKPKLEAAESVLTPAAQREPKNGRWQAGLAILSVTKRDMKAAKSHAEKAVELDPKSATAHYWLGNALFNDINNVGMLDKMSYASKGRKSYEKAVELDPNHVGARVGLIQFYMNAPGIAGGSVKKAKELARQLLTIAGGEGIGHLTLAQGAAKDGDFDAANSEFDAALAVARDNREKGNVLYMKANSLLRDKKDPVAAQAAAEEMLPLAGEREPSVRFLIGESKREQKDYAGAIEQYRLVLEKNPEAINTRYGLAQCHEALGNWADAAQTYEEFAAKFPKDDRASDAKKAAVKLRKKADGKK